MLRVRPPIGFFGLGQTALESRLQQEIRNIPTCFTAKQAAEILERTAEVLRQERARVGITSGVDTADLSRRMQAAVDAAQTWRGRIPWFFQTDKTYCRDTQEYRDLVSMIGASYAEANSVVGQKQVEQQARQQLVQDLTHPELPSLPPIPTPLGAIPWTPILIGAGVLLLLRKRSS